MNKRFYIEIDGKPLCTTQYCGVHMWQKSYIFIRCTYKTRRRGMINVRLLRDILMPELKNVNKEERKIQETIGSTRFNIQLKKGKCPRE